MGVCLTSHGLAFSWPSGKSSKDFDWINPDYADVVQVMVCLPPIGMFNWEPNVPGDSLIVQQLEHSIAKDLGLKQTDIANSNIIALTATY